MFWLVVNMYIILLQVDMYNNLFNLNCCFNFFNLDFNFLELFDFIMKLLILLRLVCLCVMVKIFRCDNMIFLILKIGGL